MGHSTIGCGAPLTDGDCRLEPRLRVRRKLDRFAWECDEKLASARRRHVPPRAPMSKCLETPGEKGGWSDRDPLALGSLGKVQTTAWDLGIAV